MITWLIKLYNESRERARIEAAEIDIDAKCPACGHREGSLNVIVAQEGNDVETFIEHTCAVCNAKFHEPTIVKAATWLRKTAAREKVIV